MRFDWQKGREEWKRSIVHHQQRLLFVAAPSTSPNSLSSASLAILAALVLAWQLLFSLLLWMQPTQDSISALPNESSCRTQASARRCALTSLFRNLWQLRPLLYSFHIKFKDTLSTSVTNCNAAAQYLRLHSWHDKRPDDFKVHDSNLTAQSSLCVDFHADARLSIPISGL